VSHYCVLIIGEDPESQLEPFQESGSMQDEDKTYLEFEDETEELKTDWETTLVNYVKLPEGALFLHKGMRNLSDYESYNGNLEIPDDLKTKIPIKELHPDFDAWAMEYHGATEKEEGSGVYGYWHNPNGHWDWYELGGRWTGTLKLK
jgi:hypothetical protein